MDPIVGYQKRAIHHPGLPFLGKVLRCKQPELRLVHVWVKPELGSRVRPHEEVDQLFFCASWFKPCLPRLRLVGLSKGFPTLLPLPLNRPLDGTVVLLAQDLVPVVDLFYLFKAAFL